MTAANDHPLPDAMLLEAAAAWMARISERPLKPREQSDLRAWLARSPLHAAALDAVQRTWSLSGGVGVSSAPLPAAPARRRSLAPSLGLAAMLVAAAGATLWFAMRSEQTYVAAAGERVRVALSDGSELVLDGGSTLTVRMDLLSRHVDLGHGRIWVDVAHESVRDFDVTSRDLRVVATGTQFVVDARAGAPSSVYLIEGGVDAGNPQGNAAQRLVPGQKATHDADGLGISRPDRDEELSWRYRRLLFKDETLAAATAALHATSGVSIAFAAPALGDLRITGAFFSEDVEAFLGAVARVHRLAWRKTGAVSYELHAP